MATIAFLGLGAMGSRMVKHFVETDHHVTVWNRSQASYQAFADLGFMTAPSIQKAVEDADIVISMVSDDHASRSLWLDDQRGVLKHIKPNAIAVECSTLSPVWIRELATACQHVNSHFVSAPVVGSRPQADAKQLIFLAGGDRDVIKQVKPVLLVAGQALYDCGDIAASATLKLTVNAMLAVQVSMAAELLGFLRKQALATSEISEILSSMPVCSPVLKFVMQSMLQKNFAPLFPIELMDKDLSYLTQQAEEVQAQLPVTHAAHNIFRAAVEENLAKNNMTAVANLFSK